MRNMDRRVNDGWRMCLGSLIGGMLAVGAALVILLFGALATIKEILRIDAAPQLAVTACLIGSFGGGILAAKWWGKRRLLASLSAAVLCFLTICVFAMIGERGSIVQAQSLAELAACLVGGGLSGILFQNKNRYKGREHRK